MTELPLIPPNKYKYEDRPVFVTYGDKWHIWGPEYDMRVGEVAEVYRYSDSTTVPVEILGHVAHRLVKKHGGATVRFVMATWDHVVQEVSDDDGQS